MKNDLGKRELLIHSAAERESDRGAGKLSWDGEILSRLWAQDL